MSAEPVFTVNRYRPSWVISTQQEAVRPLRYGVGLTAVRVPSAASWNADTLPLPAPACALLTNSWSESVGRNSEPIGPRSCAAYGEPAAAASRPFGWTTKESISEVLSRVPTTRSPAGLKNTSPTAE